MRFRLFVVAFCTVFTAQWAMADVTKFVRYDHDGQASYGIVDGDRVWELNSILCSGQ